MPAEITMPQLSDTMTEGKVVKWHKKEGDRIAAGEEVADIETDKAVMPMEAFESGTLVKISVAEGQSAPVGAVLGVIATGKESAAEVKKPEPAKEAVAVVASQEAKAMGPASAGRDDGVRLAL